MKELLLAIISISAISIWATPTLGFEDVGGNYGSSWLEKYGTKPASTFETPNALWNWGSAPKGFALRNGTLYPPGTVPQWYYPILISDYSPIVINQSELSNSQLGSSNTADPWLLAQLTGRPVNIINQPKSTLF
jgi:hypothetical protein